MSKFLVTFLVFLFYFFNTQFLVAESLMIKIDGSSTVYPITEAIAEEYRGVDSKVKVLVGISGTGGGFKKFCAREIDIIAASRPIKQIERDLCKKNSVGYIEIPVAYDALSVVVNPKNTWVDSITVDELKRIWEPAAQGVITKWNQVRSYWPDRPITLFGPGVDSGTYDYFTEVIVGKEHSSRGDFTSSEDDNIVVQGVASDINALGFFGMAYYFENKEKLRVLAIDDGNGPQFPSVENVVAGSYRLLARPLFIYVKVDSLEKDAIHKFVSYYLENTATLASEVGYIKLSKELQQLAMDQFEDKITGSVYELKGLNRTFGLAELMKAYRSGRTQNK